MRLRLYRTAVDLIRQRGYEGATLRDVAAAARVSPALLYRYFPNKRAVVLAFYDELSETFERRSASLEPGGRWRDRFAIALDLTLEVLGPHRVVLRALVPIMIGDPDEGVLAPETAFSRVRVMNVFERVVIEASDAPKGLAPALGRVLYLAHLGVILWWLLDRSPRQRATMALVALIRQMLPSAALALKLRSVRGFVQSADGLFREGLLGGATHRGS
jgi:AcrR family transcriptional regulator